MGHESGGVSATVAAAGSLSAMKLLLLGQVLGLPNVVRYGHAM